MENRAQHKRPGLITVLCSFKLFPVLLDTVGLPGTMGGLAIVCFAGAAIITIFLPETRGKSLLPTAEGDQCSENGRTSSINRGK